MDKIKRVLDVGAKAEVRQVGGKMFVDGMIPYGSRSEVIYDFVEIIDPSAFLKTLSDGSNVFAFWAHDEGDVLASRDAGTLTLDNRPEGLGFSIELRATCEDEFAAISRGDVTGVSFGFQTVRDEWDYSPQANGQPAVRTLKEVRLLEISPGVAFPAYTGAQSAAALRSLAAEQRSLNAKPLAPKVAPAPVLAPPDTAPEEEDRAALEAMQRAELTMIRARLGLTG